MSEQATIVTTGLIRYIANLVTPEDPFLIALREQARQDGVPTIWVAPEQAVLMQILLRLVGARRVVEVGALVGYSALAMAKVLPADGRVDTIELDPRYAEMTRRNVARSSEASKVQVILGNAVEVLPTLPDNAYDVAFIDADKGNYPLYFSQARRLVRSGGLILVDNAFAYGQLLEDLPQRKDDVWAIRAFNTFMSHQAGLTSVIVPIGDGMWVSIKA